jgi:hypothetical protein|tara:strand:+ start:45 stop:626 length:582 start_codon:yes stop_codon:yes gene_type:complete
MKRILLTIALGLGLLTANAQVEKLAGPRVGFTYVTAGPIADFLHDGFDFDEDEDGGYGSTGPAFTTLYGWQWESRFADGGGNITGIVEWIVLVGGMERGKFLPSASSIIGARTDKGLEFGIGPNLSLAGIGMVFGVGYNFKSGRLNLPVNISVLPGRKMTGEIQNQGGNWQTEEYEYNTGTRIAITLGFNMSK